MSGEPGQKPALRGAPGTVRGFVPGLKANNGRVIGELEELTGETVLVKSDPALHRGMFDIH